MTGDTVNGATPWWFSGPMPGDESETARDRSASGGFSLASLASLASGAQQMVEMAKQAIIVPHADHDDPSAHGSCIICRGLVVLDEARGRPDGAAGDQRGAGQARAAVRWIDLDPARPDAGRPDVDPRLWP